MRQIWKTSALLQFARIFIFLVFLSYLLVDFFFPDFSLNDSGGGEFFKFRNSVEGTGAERLAGEGCGVPGATQAAGGVGPVGGPGGLGLTRRGFAEVKLELPPGVERRGGTGGVACREGVTAVAAAAVWAVEVTPQGTGVDLAALVTPQVLLESPAVGCLDLPRDRLERLSLRHQTDPQPHVVEALQCNHHHQSSQLTNQCTNAIANNWLANFIISSRLCRAAMH